MRTLVIGGTGHVGRHMVPKLLAAGIEVSVLSSGRTPPPDAPLWEKVEYIQQDYRPGVLAPSVMKNPPDTVIDMLGAKHTYDLFHTITGHIVVCGSIWMYGEPKIVPTPEEPQTVPCPFETYAQRFERIQHDLKIAETDGVQYTAIMPPNICGPGKIPLEGMGGRSIEVHRSHAAGEKVFLPEGAECFIGPCDAEDVADLFVRAVQDPQGAAGEIFNVGSAYALTSGQFVRTIADIYETTIPIEYVSWETYTGEISTDIGAYWHFKAHMCPDIRKARTRLDYEPKYTPEQTMERAIRWMREKGLIS